MLMSPKTISVARTLLCLSARLLAVLSAVWLATLTNAFAADNLHNSPFIFDVRRSLPLEPTEPVYHDFYINAGPEAGFRKGLFVTAVRLVPVHDPVANRQQGELPVQVARLQVVQVSPSITVARLISEFNDEERPTLEFESVMIGDRIDLSTLNAEGPKKKTKNAHARRVFDESAVATAEEQKARVAGMAASEAHVPMVSSITVATAPVEAPRAPNAAPQEKNTDPKVTPVAADKPAETVAKTASPAAPEPAMVPVPAPPTPH